MFTFVERTKNEKYCETKALEMIQCERKAEKYPIWWSEYFEKITKVWT